MTRKIKPLGIAFVAITAMCMASASVAQASELHATTSLNNASIFGDQEEQHTFLTTTGQAKCNAALFEATVIDEGQSSQQLTAQELTVTATYGNGANCTAGGLNAQVVMNGCKYTFTNKSKNDGQGVTTAKTAYVDITGCTPGKVIEITNAGSCVKTVPEQHNLGKVQLTNVVDGSAHDVTVDIDVQGITYEAHGLCPNMQGATSTKLHHNGRYHGKSTVQVKVDQGNQQVTLHNHQYVKLGQSGAPISIEAT